MIFTAFFFECTAVAAIFSGVSMPMVRSLSIFFLPAQKLVQGLVGSFGGNIIQGKVESAFGGIITRCEKIQFCSLSSISAAGLFFQSVQNLWPFQNRWPVFRLRSWEKPSIRPYAGNAFAGMDPDKQVLREFHRAGSDGKRYHGYGIFINLGMGNGHARISGFTQIVQRRKGAKKNS
jgi:hypothetical protein